MFTKSTPCAGCQTGLSAEHTQVPVPVRLVACCRVDAKHVTRSPGLNAKSWLLNPVDW